VEVDSELADRTSSFASEYGRDEEPVKARVRGGGANTTTKVEQRR
jgi:hypothetical protein